jgi:hypothetical protein
MFSLKIPLISYVFREKLLAICHKVSHSFKLGMAVFSTSLRLLYFKFTALC